MIDHRFYPEPNQISVDEIVKLIKGKKHRGSGSLMVRHVGPAEQIGAGGLCFVQSKVAAESVADKKDVVCLTTPDLVDHLGSNISAILTPEPKHGFGLIIRHMFADQDTTARLDPGAAIADDAEIGADTIIETGVSIGSGVQIGAKCRLKSGVSIERGCIIGDGCIIGPNASISYAMIGSDCRIGPSTVIGYAGFGVGRDRGNNMIVPHLGRVIIGDYCDIGGNTSIDRGFIDDTVIGNHVMIDNLVHISHNVKIGDGNVICGQVGIAGSTQIGDNNIFGAQSGVADHISIGSGNVFAARAGVTRSIADGQVMAGFPAVSARDFKKEVATLRRLAAERKSSQ
jgi:UDP-3-O-[3-hydroxymyristoyl] glucosamine N-acyltransferase